HDEERSDSEQQNGCASLFWIVDSCGQDNDRRQGQPQDIGHEAWDATAAAYVVQLIQRKQLQPKVWRNRREDPKHQVGRDEYHPDGEQLWRGLKRLRGNGLPRLRENEPREQSDACRRLHEDAGSDEERWKYPPASRRRRDGCKTAENEKVCADALRLVR